MRDALWEYVGISILLIPLNTWEIVVHAQNTIYVKKEKNDENYKGKIKSC